jgi:hypothetical protein
MDFSMEPHFDFLFPLWLSRCFMYCSKYTVILQADGISPKTLVGRHAKAGLIVVSDFLVRYTWQSCCNLGIRVWWK